MDIGNIAKHHYSGRDGKFEIDGKQFVLYPLEADRWDDTYALLEVRLLKPKNFRDSDDRRGFYDNLSEMIGEWFGEERWDVDISDSPHLDRVEISIGGGLL
jgi:hypothetical protein